MAISIDSQAVAGAPPERMNRHNAQARQERWMAQLQDALFVQSAPGAAPAAAAKAQGHTAQTAQAPDGQRHAGGSQEARQQAHGMRAAAARTSGAAVAPAAADIGLGAAIGAGMPAAPGFGMVAPWAMAAAAAEMVQEAPPAALPAPARLTPAGAWRLAAAAAEEAAPEQPAAQHSAPAPAEQDYALRRLHLYQGGENIQAWLRDAALTPGQAAAVAAALASELSGQGQALAALTINGKRMEAGALRRAADAARGAADFESFAAGGQLPAHQLGKA